MAGFGACDHARHPNSNWHGAHAVRCAPDGPGQGGAFKASRGQIAPEKVLHCCMEPVFSPRVNQFTRC